MSLNLYTILEEVLSEKKEKREVVGCGVTTGDCASVIDSHQLVNIHYDDASEKPATGHRTIEVFVCGKTSKGNDVIRGFQVENGINGSKRGAPKWKEFKLDNITYWHPEQTKWQLTPDEAGWANAAYFNKNGDKGLSQIYAIANVDFHTEGDIEAAKTKMMTGRAFNPNRLEGGLPSGFRRRQFALRGKKNADILKNIQNAQSNFDVNQFKSAWDAAKADAQSQNKGPVEQPEEFKVSSDTEVQNQGGPITNNNWFQQNFTNPEPEYDESEEDYNEEDWENPNWRMPTNRY